LEGLGKSLFTEGGNPNPKFYQLEDGTTGTFGPEIASGSFALLCGDEVGDGREYFHIEESYRRQGAGTQALRELFTNESLAVRASSQVINHDLRRIWTLLSQGCQMAVCLAILE
jgi:hypothetical protein